MSISSRTLKINLALVSLAFLLNRSTYMCLEGLQSSLNAETGTASLAAVYTSSIISSLFLPTLVIDFLKVRKAIAAATLCYVPYTLANCYPRPYTLIPSAVLMGCGASTYWSAGRVYISDLATAFARMKGLKKDETTSNFFGIFMGVVSCCFVIGNLVTSSVLQSVPGVSDKETITHNVTYDITTLAPITNYVVTPPFQCGMHNCDQVIVENNATIEDVDQAPRSTNENQTVLTLVFLGFAVSQITSALIVLFGLKDLPNKTPKKDEQATKSLTKNENQLIQSKSSILEDATEKDICEMKELSNSARSEEVAMTNLRKPHTTRKRIAKKALETGKFMIFSISGKMLIPLTIHIGFLQSFVLGKFTKHWVNCVLGLEYIGYATSVFGFGAIVGSYGSGLLTQHVGRQIVLGALCLLELALGVFLFMWDLETSNDVWIFMLAMGILGVLYGAAKTIPPTLYSIFFPKKKEATNAAGGIWESFGSAIAYATSAYLCNTAITIILLSLSGTGTLLYFGAERIYRKRVDINNTVSNKEEDPI